MEEMESVVEPYKRKCAEWVYLEEFINEVSLNACKTLNVIHLNVRSLRKNWELMLEIFDFKTMINVDVIIFTEIAIHEPENIMYKIDGFESKFYNRNDQKGGGVGVYVRDVFSIKQIYIGKDNYSGYESVHIQLTYHKKNTNIVAIYRPPDCNIKDFIKEIGFILGSINKDHDVILIGDINIDLLKPNDAFTVNYQNVLAEFGLYRGIYGITRETMRNGKLEISCIDHIYTRTDYKVNTAIIHTHVSDHYMVAIHMYDNEKLVDNSTAVINDSNKVKPIYDENKIRKKMNEINWGEIITLKRSETTTTDSIYKLIKNEFTNIYDGCLKESVNVNRKRIHKGWITGYLIKEMEKRDSLFKRWKNAPSNGKYRREYNELRNKVNQMIRDTKNKYYVSQIESVKDNMKKTWIKINDIISKKRRVTWMIGL